MFMNDLYYYFFFGARDLTQIFCMELMVTHIQVQ